MARTNKKNRRHAVDFTLFLGIIILVLIGIVMVFSASWPEAMVKHKTGYHFLRKQFFAALGGFIVMLFTMNINYKILKEITNG